MNTLFKKLSANSVETIGIFERKERAAVSAKAEMVLALRADGIKSKDTIAKENPEVYGEIWYAVADALPAADRRLVLTGSPKDEPSGYTSVAQYFAEFKDAAAVAAKANGFNKPRNALTSYMVRDMGNMRSALLNEETKEKAGVKLRGASKRAERRQPLEVLTEQTDKVFKSFQKFEEKEMPQYALPRARMVAGFYRSALTELAKMQKLIDADGDESVLTDK